jgi:two-component system LytT family sensor kinase
MKRIGYPGLAMVWIVWTLVGSLAYARHCLELDRPGTPGKIFFSFLFWLTCFYPWIVLAPALFRLERRFPLGKYRWKNAGLLLLAGLPLAYAAAMLTELLGVILEIGFREALSLYSPWWLPPARETGVHLVLYWTTVGGASLIRCLVELGEREQQAGKFALEKSQLEATLRQAELETLRMRLNPHFLFNSLQNISVLARDDPETAAQMLARLGTLLRSALRRDGAPETTLKAEIDLTKQYLAVENMRFAERFTVSFDIAAESESALLPVFLLQPIVENAIVHGFARIDHQGAISIRSAVESEKLVITITDNGIGLPVENLSEIELGVGLASTCERLEKMYPQQHSFAIRSLPEGGTLVRLALPLHFLARVGAMADAQTAFVGR